MNRTILIGLVVVIIIILSAAVLMMQPAPSVQEYYLEQKSVNDLEPGDEIIIEDEPYYFEGTEEASDYEVMLILTDSGGSTVSTIVGKGTAVIVKEELPPGMPAPLPPAPLPVPVPVPVPYSAPNITVPAAPPTTPTPTPPNATAPISPTPAPTPSNDTNVTPATPATPPSTPAPAVCGNGVLESGEQCEPPGTSTCDASCMTIIPIPYPSHCSNGVWDGDESDFNCGGGCPVCPPATPYCDDATNNPYYPYLCSTFLGCWENSDCMSGNCDLSGAQPLPAVDPSTGTTYNTVQELRVLAGQSWIIPYSGVCK